MKTIVDPKDENLRETFEKTAEALSGKDVAFCFRDPPGHGAAGECYRTADGLHIDVAPFLDLETAYRVAVHEFAHAKLHGDRMTTMPAAEAVPGRSFRPNVPTAEDEADTLADLWIEKAHQTIKHMIRWNTTDVERAIMNLIALQTLARLKGIGASSAPVKTCELCNKDKAVLFCTCEFCSATTSKGRWLCSKCK